MNRDIIRLAQALNGPHTTENLLLRQTRWKMISQQEKLMRINEAESLLRTLKFMCLCLPKHKDSISFVVDSLLEETKDDEFQEVEDRHD